MWRFVFMITLITAHWSHYCLRAPSQLSDAQHIGLSQVIQLALCNYLKAFVFKWDTESTVGKYDAYVDKTNVAMAEKSFRSDMLPWGIGLWSWLYGFNGFILKYYNYTLHMYFKMALEKPNWKIWINLLNTTDDLAGTLLQTCAVWVLKLTELYINLPKNQIPFVRLNNKGMHIKWCRKLLFLFDATVQS